MKHALQGTPYGTVVATALPFDAALERAKALLKEEGFGVICEIDIAKTLHEKIGKAFRPYRILGACNPTIAYEALETDGQIGLLLPCNVVVQQESQHTIVSVIDPVTLMDVAQNPSLQPFAKDAGTRLSRAIQRLADEEPSGEM